MLDNSAGLPGMLAIHLPAPFHPLHLRQVPVLVEVGLPEAEAEVVAEAAGNPVNPFAVTLKVHFAGLT